jgi:hypothetical protein
MVKRGRTSPFVISRKRKAQEILRENKRKTRVRYEPSFWSDVTCVGDANAA